MTSPALNQILFGPPGTGKTYATIEAALEILDPDFLQSNREDRATLKKRFDELAADGHVEFVTFHQSFSYEDFVEGLRAVSGEDGQLRYEVADGVFKNLCSDASADSSRDPSSAAKSLGSPFRDSNADGALGQCFSKGESFGRGYVVESSSTELLSLIKPNGKQLPIGMSILNTLAEYVRAGRLTVADINIKSVFDKIPETKLEPYLVNGYNNILPTLVERVLSRPHNEVKSIAMGQHNSARVLIIDEINRGNISRIFGELITLVEPSKRMGAEESLEITLPYSKERFSVPGNVYLIGTMNTTDRSLAGLDIALRRRFTFREMTPKPELLKNVVVEGINVGQLLNVMNQRIELLLDRDHCLGHAYFMSLEKDSTVERLGQIFREQIVPLLQEYFFEDWQRIQWVLNDHRKAFENCFIQQPSISSNSIFGDQVTLNSENNHWNINEDAFARIESFWGIIDHQSIPPKIQEGIEAEKDDILVRQLESGSIEVLKSGKIVSPSKPILRELAAAHGLTTHHVSGREFNTRHLGVAVIGALKGERV
ncbi:McrB family protein [Pseudomonas sp. PB106]|uniref:McrB family protein n=1 Tax=Pseudomonas sp. PB106 TaxID=2494699 RepID=UPI00131DEE8D|nr:AAA family ATPase [Pseudomonas sp. PB106]KAE9644378.1 ATPase [Pseudomonas sp. PB106]